MSEQPYIGVVCPSKDVKNSGGRPQVIDLEKLKELYARGMTDGEIAAEIGMERTTVAKARKRLGLPPNRRVGERGRVKVEKIIACSRSTPYDDDMEWLKEQQAIHAAEMSKKMRVAGMDLLKWAGSAYELNLNRNKYICTLEPKSRPADLPSQISILGANILNSGYKKGKGGGRKAIEFPAQNEL